MQVSRSSNLPVQSSVVAKQKIEVKSQELSEPVQSLPDRQPTRKADSDWKIARNEWQALSRAVSTDQWLAARVGWQSDRDMARVVAADATPLI
jgi:hypothetical protein